MAEPIEMASKARESKGGADVKEDLAALRADLHKLIEDVAKLAKDRVGEDVGESPAKIKEAVDENVTELTDHARDYIRENPLSACATALAAGVALALLLKR